VVSVTEAVERDIKAISRRDKALADSALAALALSLAAELDNQGNSATSKSMCAKTLLDALERLQELAPDEETKDNLDDLSARRAARLARRTGT
jgi:hypothetical protein